VSGLSSATPVAARILLDGMNGPMSRTIIIPRKQRHQAVRGFPGLLICLPLRLPAEALAKAGAYAVKANPKGTRP